MDPPRISTTSLQSLAEAQSPTSPESPNFFHPPKGHAPSPSQPNFPKIEASPSQSTFPKIEASPSQTNLQKGDAALSGEVAPTLGAREDTSGHLDSWGSRSDSRRSRSRLPKTQSTSTSGSKTVSPSSSDRVKVNVIGRIGVCALDVKARSKASRNILTRLSAHEDFEVIIFGDKVILDEDVENWPKCDFLISFFSDGFPLDKAIAYQHLRKPFMVNDLPMQKVLWDRRICLRILDNIGVPTPKRLEVNRDGGPRLDNPKLAQHLYKMSGVKLTSGRKPQSVSMSDDNDSLIVDGVVLHKPFVEKPTSGEDHNIHIYFPASHPVGGGRRLFRKIGNKSSEWDANLIVPRAITEPSSSYLYEQFLRVDNAEDIKAYTVGPDYCHAETRTSPVVDGLVRRNTHGKEIRYICKLTPEEQVIARKIPNGFGQRVCGFDMLRVQSQSFVIDVNGWSFVKDNNDYYDKCSQILREIFLKAHRQGEPEIERKVPRSEFVKRLIKSPSNSKLRHQSPESSPVIPNVNAPEPAAKHSWKLKGMVSVIRHADRTPKQKYKFTFHTQPFIELLRGHQEEVFLKGETALNSVLEAAKVAMQEGIEDGNKLALLETALTRKGAWTGTKVQIKPMFRKRKPEEIDSIKTQLAESSENDDPFEDRPCKRTDSLAGTTLSRFSAAENDLVVDKLQLIVKWGGEPTHAARYQSQDLGENMRADLLLMNKEALNDVRVFTSSEKRVTTSGESCIVMRRIWWNLTKTAQIWAASFLNKQDMPESAIQVRKDLLDDSNAAKDVMDKVKKKLKLLLREGHPPPSQFAWPPNTPEPSEIVKHVAELMVFHRRVMRHNFQRLENGSLSSKSTENLIELGKLTSVQSRWCCSENPELFKERWEKLFTEFCDSEKIDPSKISELYDTMKFDALHNRQFLEWAFTPTAGEDFHAEDKRHAEKSHHAHRLSLRRRSVVSHEPGVQTSYFKLYAGTGQSRAKQDARLGHLRDLYKYAKILFDYICPQEYGISNGEKLEIGLLTSLPLLKEIVHDLEEVQASEDAKTFVYFTKESHIYTLLNCILEGGIKTKIERNAIPELDYLSSITFELYEAEDKDANAFSYSIRISITPGCHTFDPLDVQLDSKHSIGCAPRRSLTQHEDWLAVIETLRAKFHTVKLPKTFLAVNVSEAHDN